MHAMTTRIPSAGLTLFVTALLGPSTTTSAMVYVDQTGAFRQLVAEGSKSANSSPGSSRPHSRASSRHRQQQVAEDDGFLKEAYQIVRRPWLLADISTATSPTWAAC